MTLNGDITIEPYHITSALSILACLWLLFKYIKQMNKGVKSLLIVILAVADMMFSVNQLLEYYWIEYQNLEIKIHFFLNSFYTCFSILWASAIAYVVYKNLADKYVDLKKLFIKVLFVISALTLIVSVLMSWLPEFVLSDYSSSLSFGALLFSVLVTSIFYKKSLNILRDQSRYEQRSTSLYIKNLRYFSFVQLLTFGPLMILPFIDDYLFEKIGKRKALIEDSLFAFACLSGFLTVVVFACQGGLKANSDDEAGRDNDADLDLTGKILA